MDELLISLGLAFTIGILFGILSIGLYTSINQDYINYYPPDVCESFGYDSAETKGVNIIECSKIERGEYKSKYFELVKSEKWVEVNG